MRLTPIDYRPNETGTMLLVESDLPATQYTTSLADPAGELAPAAS